MKSVSLLALMISILAIAGLIVRQAVLADDSPLVAVQLAAIGLMVWARLIFGRRSFHAAADPTEGGVVTSGPYAYIRHPIYASALYFLWAGTLSHLSIINLALVTIVTAALTVRARAEEQLLVVRYPEYATYAARTKRFIPFVI